MNPGAMRDTLLIFDRRGSQAANGYVAAEEKPLFVIRARRTWVSDREIWAAYAAQVKSVLSWEARYREGIRPGMWVLWQGQWHEIIAVQQPPGIPKRMILKTAQKQAK